MGLSVWKSTLTPLLSTVKKSKKQCAKHVKNNAHTTDKTTVLQTNTTRMQVMMVRKKQMRRKRQKKMVMKDVLHSAANYLICHAANVHLTVKRSRTWKTTTTWMLQTLQDALVSKMLVMMVLVLFTQDQCVPPLEPRSRLVFSLMRTVCSLPQALMLRTTLPTEMDTQLSFPTHFLRPLTTTKTQLPVLRN